MKIDLPSSRKSIHKFRFSPIFRESHLQSNLDALEKETGLTRDVLVKNLVEEVSHYIKEQANLAIQRKNLIKRLKSGLETLLKTQKFMDEQVSCSIAFF